MTNRWNGITKTAQQLAHISMLAALSPGQPLVAQDIPTGRKSCPQEKSGAPPDKPGGYLRESILRVLTHRIQDGVPLPEDSVASGGFDDLITESEVGDEVAKIAAANAIREYLGFRKRLVVNCGKKAAEEESEDEDEDEDNDEGSKDEDDDVFEGFD